MSLYYHPETGELARAESDRDKAALSGASTSGRAQAAKEFGEFTLADSPQAAGWVEADWQEGDGGELILVDAESGIPLCYPDGATIYASEWD